MNVLAFVLAQVLTESVTVTATGTETRVADTSASVVVISGDDLRNSAAPAADDALRQVAGFTLFRRTGSRVANPTAQGVSLRGVGASGASRALVLDDGVPLNDPFGGWVHWGRVPRLALERVEVLRGGASDLYGSSAMGGVIQFVRRRSPALSAEASAGQQETRTLALFWGGRRGSVSVDWLTTEGYVLVRPAERGPVDVEAGSRRLSLDGTLRRDAAFLRGSYYTDSRRNGTPLQENDTTIGQLTAGAAFGALALRAWALDQDYFQTFTAVEGDRRSERLTVRQQVPSRAFGASVQWTRAPGQRHVIVTGAEARQVRGTSEEIRYTPSGTVRVEAGGRQQTGAVYLEDLFAVTPALSVTAGVRGDWVRSAATEWQVNPRVAVLWRPGRALSYAASAYTAFRSPTLNELYRGFRVGNVNTLPNAELKAETLSGFELGARTRYARLTLFWMSVSDAIANVTVSQTPSLITRQRRNLGRTRSIGAELDAEWRVGAGWRASASWLFAAATVREGELRGRRVPQVPRHQATVQLNWRTVGAQLRWSGAQFDDDRNHLPLRGYFVADLFASHPIRPALAMTLAVENVFGEEIEAGATPVITLGQPRSLRIGVRWKAVADSAQGH